MRIALATGLAILLSAPAFAQTFTSDRDSAGPRIVFQSVEKNIQGVGEAPLTLDVFWCSGDTNAITRSLAASELAGGYGLLIKAGSVKEQILVRTRPIIKDVFLNGINLAPNDARLDNVIVQYDATDARLTNIYKEVLSKGLRPAVLISDNNAAYAPNYIAAYVCGALDATSITGRLFFQVQTSDQTKEALIAGSHVKDVLPSLTVIRDIEVVGNKSPKSSELRYFFEADAELAKRTAVAISSSTSENLAPKLITGYENKVRPGTLEAWFSTQNR